jgi:diguanylate cyclase (GGDEF)-like protein
MESTNLARGMHRLSLATKFTLALLIPLALGIDLLAVTLAQFIGSQTEQNAETSGRAIADGISASLRAQLDEQMAATRTLRDAVLVARASGTVSRGWMTALMRNALEDNPLMLGVWSCWEPNAIDGRDAEFVGKSGNDAHGRYANYVVRYRDGIRSEPLEDYEGESAIDYYALPRRTLAESVVEPYNYQQDGHWMTLTTLGEPIVIDGKFAGAIGSDIDLAALQQIVSRSRPLGTGRVSLISANGKWISDTGADRIGKDIGADDPALAQLVPELAAGHAGVRRARSAIDGGIDVLRIFVPLSVGRTGTNWSVMITLPADALFSDARRFTTIIQTAGVALSLLTAVAFGIPAIAWYRRTREKLRADAEIDFLAHHDAMTGLANRNQVVEKLRRALEASDGVKLALHYVDIDRFQDINDALGHDAGDGLIKSVAERLRAFVGQMDLVARIAGDEFAVLQLETGNVAGAASLARRLCEHLASPYLLNGRQVAATCSIGVAVAPDHGEDAQTLMRGADLALHKSKTEGRNCVRFFSSELETELQARLVLEKTIRDATLNDGFELYFQPLFSVTESNLVGFEALLRLRSDDGTFISPTDFIPVAEEIGLIDRIGAWVLRNACAIAVTWPNHLTVAVNLSPAQFTGTNVFDVVGTTLAQTGLAAERLELEITESLLLGDTGAVRDELARLKALGVAIVMDDFGTGYSSLSYLWRFPFDKIKVDRSFIQAFDAADQNAETVIRTIVGLGHSLKMRVTVEGVETTRQADFLRNVACDNMQGFLLGRPMPTVDVAACIAADVKTRYRERHKSKPAGQSHRAPSSNVLKRP